MPAVRRCVRSSPAPAPGRPSRSISARSSSPARSPNRRSASCSAITSAPISAITRATRSGIEPPVDADALVDVVGGEDRRCRAQSPVICRLPSVRYETLAGRRNACRPLVASGIITYWVWVTSPSSGSKTCSWNAGLCRTSRMSQVGRQVERDLPGDRRADAADRVRPRPIRAGSVDDARRSPRARAGAASGHAPGRRRRSTGSQSIGRPSRNGGWCMKTSTGRRSFSAEPCRRPRPAARRRSGRRAVVRAIVSSPSNRTGPSSTATPQARPRADGDPARPANARRRRRAGRDCRGSPPSARRSRR